MSAHEIGGGRANRGSLDGFNSLAVAVIAEARAGENHRDLGECGRAS